jgi:hypothetical protein
MRASSRRALSGRLWDFLSLLVAFSTFYNVSVSGFSFKFVGIAHRTNSCQLSPLQVALNNPVVQSTSVTSSTNRRFPLPPSKARPPPRYTSNDWMLSLGNIWKSRILRRVGSHLIFTTAWTTLLTVLFKRLKLVSQVSNPLPWTLLAGVLSLLLVFRTNSAYDRFWEGTTLSM